MTAEQQEPSASPERLRTGLAFAVGAATVLFAVLNLDEVDVSWIIGTWRTPLIAVILVSALLGMALGWILAKRQRNK